MQLEFHQHDRHWDGSGGGGWHRCPARATRTPIVVGIQRILHQDVEEEASIKIWHTGEQSRRSRILAKTMRYDVAGRSGNFDVRGNRYADRYCWPLSCKDYFHTLILELDRRVKK